MRSILIFIATLLLTSGCCARNELQADATRIEGLFAEADAIVASAQMDRNSRQALADVRLRALVLWAELKEKHGAGGEPWLEILGILASRALEAAR